ncbi:MAG: hypothetical protein VYC00_02490, partial [Candidatus Neomarinimicrobiota bacterium]|nr:hypothetical protein [Candidatus Neomarinimicrobiota bacterium]
MKNNYLLTFALIFSFIFALDKSNDSAASIEQEKDSKEITFDVEKVQKTRHWKENLNESFIQHKRESVKDHKSDQARKKSRSLRKKANHIPEVKTQVRKAFKMKNQKVAENKKPKEKFKFSSKVSKKQSVKKSTASGVSPNVSRDSKYPRMSKDGNTRGPDRPENSMDMDYDRVFTDPVRYSGPRSKNNDSRDSKHPRMGKGGNTRGPDRPENSMDMDYDRVFTDPVRYSGPRSKNSVQGHSLNVDDSRDENNLELVALIQNEAPWGYNRWEQELEAREINYDLLPTSALESMDYDQYDMIITAGSGNVDNYVFDAGSAIFEYVENGGIAFVSLCSQGLEGTFGDLTVNWGTSDSTYFLDEDHPLVDGVENPAWGNSASHTHFTEIVDGWTEFSVGDGGIVTSVIRDGFFVHGLTLELGDWPQAQMAGNALDFAMGYDPGDDSTATVHITFSVDMQNEEVSEEGVHIAGSNNNDWADFGVDPETGETLPAWDPGGIEMHDDDGDGVFDVTLELEQFTGYEYKFVNGDEWGEEEFGGVNRSFYTQDWDEILPVVCYGSWDPCENVNIELVALIQNQDAWGNDVWQQELEAREINYDLLPT